MADDSTTEEIAPRFRKTKTEKWAVMAPVEALEKALAEGGKIDVQRRSGDWSTFQVASLGRPFDVDGVQMCYGYGPDDDEGTEGGSGGSGPSGGGSGTGDRQGGRSDRSAPRGQGGSGGASPRGRRPRPEAPPTDPSEPLPEYQGGPEDEWDGGF